MSKFAPANAEGLKPYVVSVRDWGRKYERIVYATTVSGARGGYGRMGTGQYIAGVRRATPEDIEANPL